MDQALFEIYERNFPFNIRKKDTVLQILGHRDNVVLERREEGKGLIGVSVIHRNAVLMLCVDGKYRNRGIGTQLLEKSEQLVRERGFSEIVIGAGHDYLMPGVPTSRRYFQAENERLYENLDESAVLFFEKRGYVHSWECNCFDMMVSFNGQEKEDGGISVSGDAEEGALQAQGCRVGDQISGITYRWAQQGDLRGVCECTQNACPEFTEYYQNESLYAKGSDERALIAVAQEGQVAGTLIVGVEDKEKQIGSVGCTTVRRSFQGRHIAVNLVCIGTGHLRKMGMREAFLGYTYSGLDHLYGYAGYKIRVYYMMAKKALG